MFQPVVNGHVPTPSGKGTRSPPVRHCLLATVRCNDRHPRKNVSNGRPWLLPLLYAWQQRPSDRSKMCT
jgi:hypothetical protein